MTHHIPIKDYRFLNYDGLHLQGDSTQTGMAEITCKYHPTARYVTKNPYQRSLHFTEPCQEWKDNPNIFGGKIECPCAFSDLVVIVDDDEYERFMELHAARNEATTEAGFDS